MDMLEIILLVAGGIIFILSFLIPDKNKKVQETAAPVSQEEIRSMVNHEIESVRDHVDEVVEEAVTYAMEKTERSLERLSNEKIMAINEYSDTVLSEIHKNHEEAVFLYDMLNSKHTNLKNTVSEVNRTVKEAEETVGAFQRLSPEPVVVLQRSEPTPEPVKIYQAPIPKPVVETAPKAAFVRMAEEQIERDSREAKRRILTDGIRETLAELDASDNSNERILELYGRGMDKLAIARELGLGVGEVKLVIDLFEDEKTDLNKRQSGGYL